MVQDAWDEEVSKVGTEVDSMWGGSLTDVKEVKTLIPPSKNVKLLITGVTMFDKYENGDARNWKQILFNLKIVDGIEIGGEVKHKGQFVSQILPYFANPATYDYTKPFFAKGQFLTPLVQLVKATDANSPSLIKGGLTDIAASELAESLVGKMILGSIMQTKATVKNPETNKYEATDELVNEVKFFKKLPDSSLV